MISRSILAALTSYWRRNPLQLMTLTIGLALATALWSGVQAINAEARASYDTAASQVGAGQFDRLIASGNKPLSQTDYITLRRAGWQVSPQITFDMRVDGQNIQIIGIEPLTRPTSDPGLLGANALQDIPLDQFLGGTLAIGAPDSAKSASSLGLSHEQRTSVPGNTLIVDIGTAQRFAGRGDLIDSLLILPEQPRNLPTLETLAPHLSRVTASASGSDIARLTDSFHLNLTAFGLLSFAVGLFIVYGAIGLAFEQRRAMLRTLRALGVSLRHLIALLAAELILIALIAGTVGVALGYIIAAALLPDVAATLDGLYGADVSGTLTLRPAWWLSGLAMALIGTFIAGAGTLWRLSRMPLLAAGTPEAWSRGARKVMRAMSYTGLFMLAIALILAVTATTLVHGFVLLGALLVGSALVLPRLLDITLAFATRTSPPGLHQWFWADSRQQVPGLSMALMALLLAMAANVGVSTMVSSFRLTFVGWLDQRLASEIYITTKDPEQADAMKTLLAGQVDAILPLLNHPVEIGGTPGEVYAIADHPTYRDHWPLLAAVPDVWDILLEPDTALINEQLSLRQNLKVGDRVPSQNNERIVGIYSDYGNPSPQIIISLKTFTERYPNQKATRFGLRVAPEQTQNIIGMLQSELNIPQDAIADQARIKRLSLDIFEQTFTVTGALNILTLAVAGFSILMSLLTLSQMRLPQLAPIWALGVTRSQLGRFELARALALSLLVTLIAIPLGLALAWVLLAKVNVVAFGWRLPMFLFPGAYLVLTLAALVAAFVAAGWPALRLARIAPARLLQVFSSGR